MCLNVWKWNRNCRAWDICSSSALKKDAIEDSSYLRPWRNASTERYRMALVSSGWQRTRPKCQWLKVQCSPKRALVQFFSILQATLEIKRVLFPDQPPRTTTKSTPSPGRSLPSPAKTKPSNGPKNIFQIKSRKITEDRRSRAKRKRKVLKCLQNKWQKRTNLSMNYKPPWDFTRANKEDQETMFLMKMELPFRDRSIKLKKLMRKWTSSLKKERTTSIELRKSWRLSSKNCKKCKDKVLLWSRRISRWV